MREALATLAAFCLLLGSAAAFAQGDAPPDSTSRGGGILEELQRQDFEFFPDDILNVDDALSDSLVAELEELGFDGYEKLAHRRSRRFDFDLEPGTQLLNFNRVEGFVPAMAMELKPWGPRSVSLRGEAGYAFASEEFRHLSELEYPWLGRKQRMSLRLHYADRVQPFGSNRPFANSLRALVAGADEQDYLRGRGGGAELSWGRGRVGAQMGYEAARETAVPVETDFAFLRELGPTNAAISEGIDRSVVVGFQWGRSTLEHFQANVAHRVSGGALGGDFSYTRTDLSVVARRYLHRFEFSSRLYYAVTGGTPPPQRLADVGGITTVRGYPRRALVGESSVAGSLEVLVPYDLLRRTHIPWLGKARLQFVPFADAARVFDGTSDQWIHSAGLGIQRFIGAFGRASNLRLDLAFPVGPNRPTDFHTSLSFTAGIL